MNISLANISDLNNNDSLITFTNSSFDLSVCGNLSPDYIRVRERILSSSGPRSGPGHFQVRFQDRSRRSKD